AAVYDLPVQWGVYVTAVVPGSPADKAGIQRGDIIIKIGEISIDENHSYINALFQYKPGDQITIQYARGSKIQKTEVVLGESPSQ
ncbi:MAG: PDZ domain-containing protein, partial [Anaerolineales bacterium]